MATLTTDFRKSGAVGDNFYLVGGGQIRIYDMANDYKEVGRLEL